MSTTHLTPASLNGSSCVRAAVLYRSAVLARAELLTAAIERFDIAEEIDEREAAAAQLLAAVLIADARYETTASSIADHLVRHPGPDPQAEAEA